MEMPNAARINANLGEAALNEAPHFFGRKLGWDDVSDMIELLNKETRKPHLCISKGQLKRACEGLLIQNLMLQKRMGEVLAEASVALGKHPIVFTEDGRLHSTIPASEVLKVFLNCIPILERDAQAQAAEVVPEGEKRDEPVDAHNIADVIRSTGAAND